MSFEYKEEYQYFTNACLNVTDACNLKCTYCFVQQHPHFMDLETAKKCVDFLANNIKKKNRKNGTLTFFGGEPTLLWDEIIVPVVHYTEENYPNLINFTITTNGTLLNKERIDFMYDHKISPHLSCDGDEVVQNTNRPARSGEKSFDMVNKNIPYLLSKFPNTTMRATISQDTVDETFNSYLFATKNGFRSYFTTPNCREVWTEENIKKLDYQVKLIYSFIFACFVENVKPINFSSIDKTFTQILQGDLQTYFDRYSDIDIERSVMRCGLGTVGASFGYDGKIYGCQEQNSYEVSDFYIGDIYNGIDTERHSVLLKQYAEKATQYCIDKEECEDCPLRYTCQNTSCPSVNYDLYKNFFTRSVIDCKWNQMLFENALPVMKVLVANENECFKNYLNNECGYSDILKGD